MHWATCPWYSTRQTLAVAWCVAGIGLVQVVVPLVVSQPETLPKKGLWVLPTSQSLARAISNRQ